MKPTHGVTMELAVEAIEHSLCTLPILTGPSDQLLSHESRLFHFKKALEAKQKEDQKAKQSKTLGSTGD